MQCPKVEHWKAVKRILRYLCGTLDFGLHITISTHLNLTDFSDSDWASDPDDRRSTSGWCAFLGSVPITWSSKKQCTVSRSSTEAEYRSIASSVAEILWLCSLMFELHIPLTQPLSLYCDNQGAVHLAANPVLHN